MNVKIYYCKSWGFHKEASRIEEELSTNFKEIDVELVEGKLGQFTIYLNDKKIIIRWNWLDDYLRKWKLLD